MLAEERGKRLARAGGREGLAPARLAVREHPHRLQHRHSPQPVAPRRPPRGPPGAPARRARRVRRARRARRARRGIRALGLGAVLVLGALGFRAGGRRRVERRRPARLLRQRGHERGRGACGGRARAGGASREPRGFRMGPGLGLGAAAAARGAAAERSRTQRQRARRGAGAQEGGARAPASRRRVQLVREEGRDASS